MFQDLTLDPVADVFFSNVDKHTEDDELPVRLCNYVDVYKNEKITGDWTQVTLNSPLSTAGGGVSPANAGWREARGWMQWVLLPLTHGPVPCLLTGYG